MVSERLQKNKLCMEILSKTVTKHLSKVNHHSGLYTCIFWNIISMFAVPVCIYVLSLSTLQAPVYFYVHSSLTLPSPGLSITLPSHTHIMLIMIMFSVPTWWSVRGARRTFDVNRCCLSGSTFFFCPQLRLGLAVTGSSGWKLWNADTRCQKQWLKGLISANSVKAVSK